MCFVLVLFGVILEQIDSNVYVPDSNLRLFSCSLMILMILKSDPVSELDLRKLQIASNFQEANKRGRNRNE